MRIQTFWPTKRLVSAGTIIGWATDTLIDEAYQGWCACDSHTTPEALAGQPCRPCQQAQPSAPPTPEEALFIVNDRGIATTTRPNPQPE